MHDAPTRHWYNPPMLFLRDVSKRYGEAVVLAPTDLEIAAEQTTVLIGPSGCGKTTLMRLMLGLITPDTGEVALQGTVLNDANILELRRRMGYVIQEGGLFPHLTARENVSLLARHLERAAGEIEARIRELAALVRLEPALL
ncbi:MAG: ATP-binding cassette domain-containing protein, partial [Pseudomonadales bacterium]|nr:ATP-binding cassette domain-containing protein [Pseudomonadales bacterium]